MTFDSSFINEVPHTVRCYPAKSRIFDAGEYAKHLFVIKKGAARIWFNKDGRDCTLQFFLENEPICIYESFIDEAPSLFTIETIEPTEVLVFGKSDLLAYVKSRPELKDVITKYVMEKMVGYIHLFLSMQINTPEQRYAELVKNRPEIIQRIPQHYIASFFRNYICVVKQNPRAQIAPQHIHNRGEHFVAPLCIF